MTDMHDRQSPSNLQLLVLARLSCSKGATEDEVGAAVAEVAPPDGPYSAHEYAEAALDVLRRRSLVTSAKPTTRTPHPPLKLTAEGRDVLRAAFGLDTAPNWQAMRDRYLPALALGISIGSEQASKLGQIDELTLAVLRQHFNIAQASTTIRLCDALIARALGFTGPVTLLRLRAHVLARELGLEPKVTSTKDLEVLAGRVAIKSLEPANDGKRPLRQALGRRWVYRVMGSPEVVPGPRPVIVSSNQTPLPLHALPSFPLVQHAPGSSPPAFPGPAAPAHAPGPTATPADMLLTLVREAIPRIGAAGRFGDEKVFVSAIWQHLEDDGRLTDWSLDRFKRWLVTANRDQLLDLARADAQGDMDSRLVEESEIGDVIPRTSKEHPGEMIRNLARLAFLSRRAVLVLMVDQAELSGSDAISGGGRMFMRAVDTLYSIVSEVPTAIAVVACLSDVYTKVRRQLQSSMLDRLEKDPPYERLHENRSYPEPIRSLSGAYPEPIRSLSGAYPEPIRSLSGAYPEPRGDRRSAAVLSVRAGWRHVSPRGAGLPDPGRGAAQPDKPPHARRAAVVRSVSTALRRGEEARRTRRA
jgi:hypothetical protein